MKELAVNNHQSIGPRKVGLGLRMQFAEELLSHIDDIADFVEIAPENFIEIGGLRRRILAQAKERWPIFCHGLCGDFAASMPLDKEFCHKLKTFFKYTKTPFYSDHLCFTNIAGVEIHDLIPLPFNEFYGKKVVQRIKILQQELEIPIAIENVSAYCRMPYSTMSETEFLRFVLDEAKCFLLLDINNVYVNSINFSFDAKEYIKSLPLDKVAQIHIAGHFQKSEKLIIDTHGADIEKNVYDLLHFSVGLFNQPPPILLERDNNIPDLSSLIKELTNIKNIVSHKYAANNIS